MKELPVKIWAYIGPHLGLIQANGCFPVGAPGEKEYIQKDALVEWANVYVMKHRNRTIADQIRASAMEELIDKLNSM